MADSIMAPDSAQPLANYPHAKRVKNTVFLSGTSARQPDNTVAGVAKENGRAARNDIYIQTKAAIENIKKVLETQGLGLKDLVDITAYLVDMADYGEFNRAYNEYFNAANGPARTTVAVKALPGPDLLVEIKAVAHDPNGQ